MHVAVLLENVRFLVSRVYCVLVPANEIILLVPKLAKKVESLIMTLVGAAVVS